MCLLCCCLDCFPAYANICTVGDPTLLLHRSVSSQCLLTGALHMCSPRQRLDTLQVISRAMPRLPRYTRSRPPDHKHHWRDDLGTTESHCFLVCATIVCGCCYSCHVQPSDYPFLLRDMLPPEQSLAPRRLCLGNVRCSADMLFQTPRC